MLIDLADISEAITEISIFFCLSSVVSEVSLRLSCSSVTDVAGPSIDVAEPCIDVTEPRNGEGKRPENEPRTDTAQATSGLGLGLDVGIGLGCNASVDTWSQYTVL